MLLALVAGVGAALVVSELTARPFKRLVHVAARLAQGELEARIEPKGPDEAGQLARAFNRMRDRLESQVASVSRERERLISVLNNLVDGVFILDDEGRIRLFNPVAARLVGLDTKANAGPRSLRGQPLARIVRDHRIVETWQDCMQDGKQAESIFQWENRTMRVIALPFVAGGSGGYIVLLQDMTELHRLERVRRDFVSNISHELRTPPGLSAGPDGDLARRGARRSRSCAALSGPCRNGSGCPRPDGARTPGAFTHRIRAGSLPFPARTCQ